MQNKNHWYRNFRFKLLAVLCAIVVLASAVFVSQPALARPAAAGNARAAATTASDRDGTFSVISRGAGKLDIFIVNGCEIWMKSWTGSIWTAWNNLGRANTGDCFYTVSAVATGNNSWDIFATVGAAGDWVWNKRFDGFATYGWEGTGHAGNGSPYGVQAVSTGNGRIDLFTRGTCASPGCGPALWKSRSATGVWSPCETCDWTVLDNTMSPFSFTALAHSGNRIDLFRRLDSNQAIGRKYYNGTSWLPTTFGIPTWQGMSGGLANETPYAVSWGTNRVDVFVRGSDDNIWIDSTGDAGTNWTGWNVLGRGATNGTPIATAPSAVAWGANRLDIFMREDGTVYHKAWTGTSWWPNQIGGWDNIGSMQIGILDIPPLPVSWGPNRIDLFKYENNTGTFTKTLYHKWSNDGINWGPSQTTWESLGP
jgi:hypothetical protein